jgi:hypothetical protein
MVALQREFRAQLKQYEHSPAKRNAILWEVLHDPVLWEMLKKDPATAREQLKSRYLHD